MRVDAGCRWDDRRAGGSFIPNAEKGFSILGIKLAQGARTPASAERWNWQSEQTGTQLVVRCIADMVTRSAGRVSRFHSARRLSCRALLECPSPSATSPGSMLVCIPCPPAVPVPSMPHRTRVLGLSPGWVLRYDGYRPHASVCQSGCLSMKYTVRAGSWLEKTMSVC